MEAINHRLREIGRGITPWGSPVIYLGWAFLFWSPILGSSTSVWELPNIAFFLIGGVSPVIAAIFMGWVTGGVERIIDLWHRLVDVRRITPQW